MGITDINIKINIIKSNSYAICKEYLKIEPLSLYISTNRADGRTSFNPCDLNRERT
jgi:hypothetical protein